ncbi:MAG: tetratricopeptide repeat protein [Deltaproteobacteria bacterium]|nr:tetratricopeptide repeat protein [Deltaproteobacteria bacterium]
MNLFKAKIPSVAQWVMILMLAGSVGGGLEGCAALGGKKQPKKASAATVSKSKAAAEEHYKTGLNHYLNQDLNNAINEWEEAIKLDPNHTKAKEGLKEARANKAKLKSVK